MTHPEDAHDKEIVLQQAQRVPQLIERIKVLEDKVLELENKHADLQQFVYDLGGTYMEILKKHESINARVDVARAGDADWNDGPMNPEHLQHGQ